MRIERAVTVPNAAAELGVNPSRVRAMIGAKLIDAVKAGNRWFIDPMSIDRRQSAGIPSGRQLTSKNAWATILLAAGETEQREVNDLVKTLSPSMLSRIRSRLAKKPLSALVPRLRGRAITYRLRAHPSALERILLEPGIVRGGISAAAEYSADIIAPGVIEGYIAGRHASRLIDKYGLELSPNPNVIVHVIDGFWPFSKSRKAVPLLAVALDLLEADDERTIRAGRELMDRLTTR